MAIFHDEEQNKKLAEIRSDQEESAIKELSESFGVGYADLSGIGINADALVLISEEVARRDCIACFAMVGKRISLATQSPMADATIDRINELEQKNYEVRVYMVSMRSLEKAWARYADVSGSARAEGGLLDISDESLQQLANTIKSNQDVKDAFLQVLRTQQMHQISKLMEIIFGSAIATKSSDVHIEAGDEQARLRFRQDGVLQDILEFPLDVYKSINSRIKLLSELKLTDTMMAQDGRFTIEYKGMDIEVRTSLIPGPHGESIVMRILNPEGLTVELEKLGIQKRLFDMLEEQIRKPNGMILTTGPTGSGKTTTLYSFLKRVYTPEVKILTIEDPIEYHLPGVTQTQVDHDVAYDFSSGLRAALRQDPDIIMVGEIRDKETASTAVNASLTGHLVLSTLHTNNAAGAIPRLIELGVSPKILPDALTVAMAQRLLRRLCPDCKQAHTLDSADEKIVRAILKQGERTGKHFSEMGISSDQKIGVYEPVGCSACDNIGYKGRVGLYEAIIVDDIVAAIIEKGPSEREVKNGALHQGIFTLIEDGITKVLSGLTSLEELKTVVDLTEDLPEGWHDNNVLPTISASQPITDSVQKEVIQKEVTAPHQIIEQQVIQPEIKIVHREPVRPVGIVEPIEPIPTPVNRKSTGNIPDLGIEFMSYPEHGQETPMSYDVFADEYQKYLTQKTKVSTGHEVPMVSKEVVHESEEKRVIPIYHKDEPRTELPSRELKVLIGYLKHLEDHQNEYPQEGIKNDIHEAKEVIIDLLRTNNPRDWSVINPQKSVHREVSQIMDQLGELEKHQSRRPNIGIAHELEKIRNTIENLIAKE